MEQPVSPFRGRVRTVAAAVLTTLAVAIPLATAAPASALPEDALPGDPALSDYSPPESDGDVTVTPIEFDVTNIIEPGSSYTLRGFLYEPAGKEGCRTSILQANHALTTGPGTGTSRSSRTATRSRARSSARRASRSSRSTSSATASPTTRSAPRTARPTARP
jgi:hypothetical protein